jgi:hypothetical protein
MVMKTDVGESGRKGAGGADGSTGGKDAETLESALRRLWQRSPSTLTDESDALSVQKAAEDTTGLEDESLFARTGLTADSDGTSPTDASTGSGPSDGMNAGMGEGRRLPAACGCDWRDWQDAPAPGRPGWIRTVCGKCGRFKGYRPVDLGKKRGGGRKKS